MNTDVRVWDAVVRHIGSVFPEIDVRRAYDATLEESAIVGSEKPILIVTLDGKNIEKICHAKKQNTFEFAMFLYAYLPSQTLEGKMAEADACLPYIDRFFDAMTEKIIMEEEMKLSLTAVERPMDQMFNLEMYTSEIFLIEMNLTVVCFQDIES